MVLSSIFFGHIIEAFQEMISAGPCRKMRNTGHTQGGR